MRKKYSYAHSEIYRKVNNHARKIKSWKYKNLFFLFLSIVVAGLVLQSDVAKKSI